MEPPVFRASEIINVQHSEYAWIRSDAVAVIKVELRDVMTSFMADPTQTFLSLDTVLDGTYWSFSTTDDGCTRTVTFPERVVATIQTIEDFGFQAAITTPPGSDWQYVNPVREGDEYCGKIVTHYVDLGGPYHEHKRYCNMVYFSDADDIMLWHMKVS